MTWCPQFDHCGCMPHAYCPFPQWKHPLLCNPAHWCCAGENNGPTLVIHQILLEPCGNQSCTPRTFTVRITGPSYPGGETFTLRAGSCTEIDEPLVIAGLTPGQYEIDLITAGCSCQYDTTITGPISCGCVSITSSLVPTVITVVSRKRTCRRSRGCSGCGNGCNGCSNGCNGCGGNRSGGWGSGCGGCGSGWGSGCGSWNNGCGNWSNGCGSWNQGGCHSC